VLDAVGHETAAANWRQWVMKSKGLFGGALIALLSMGVVACRPTVEMMTDVPGSDATRDTNHSETGGEDVVHDDATVPTDAPPTTDGGLALVTIRQVQDPTADGHPAPGTRVSLADSTMVALTGRSLVNTTTSTGADGGTTTSCRFGVWIGNGSGDDFSAVYVQELLPQGTARNCFSATPGILPMDLAPGDRISVIDDVQYREFCGGATGTPTTDCAAFEQSQLWIGNRSTFTRVGTGEAPTPVDVAVGDVVAAAGAPGPRTAALEGVLIRVRNVRVDSMRQDGGTFIDAWVVDPSDSSGTKRLQVLVSNFPQTTCTRNFLLAQNGMTLASVTGVLVPNFGEWKIRLRDEHDIEGLNCSAPDGGVPDSGLSDASAD
jgi:hypothetical protein